MTFVRPSYPMSLVSILGRWVLSRSFGSPVAQWSVLLRDSGFVCLLRAVSASLLLQKILVFVIVMVALGHLVSRERERDT